MPATAPDQPSPQPQPPEGWGGPYRFLDDDAWAALEKVLPPPSRNNLNKSEMDRREFVEALLWLAYHRGDWNDLPEGRWNDDTVRRKYDRWTDRGLIALLHDAAQALPDPETAALACIAFHPAGLVGGLCPPAPAQLAAPRGTPGREQAAGQARLVRPLSADKQIRAGQRQATGQSGGQDGEQDGEQAALTDPAMLDLEPLVRLHPETIEALAQALRAAGGSGGGGGRGRGRNNPLGVVWGDVAFETKIGLATAIAGLTALCTAPVYLNGMDPFAERLARVYELPLHTAFTVAIAGPFLTLIATVWFVQRMVRQGKQRERDALAAEQERRRQARRARQTDTPREGESEMSDDKAKRGAADHRKVAGGEDYEVRQIATTMGVSADDVHKAIKAVGNDRAKIKAWLAKNA